MLSPAETAMRSTLNLSWLQPCQLLPRGVRWLDHDKLTVPHLAAIVGTLRVLRLSSSLYGCATRTAGSKSAGECGAPTSRCLEPESRMLGRMVRFDSSTPCKAAHIVLTALSRRVQRTHRREHRSTRRTREDDRGHDSSQALGQVISPTVSPRASIFEPWSQKARVGALERKNVFQSNSSVAILVFAWLYFVCGR